MATMRATFARLVLTSKRVSPIAFRFPSSRCFNSSVTRRNDGSFSSLLDFIKVELDSVADNEIKLSSDANVMIKAFQDSVNSIVEMHEASENSQDSEGMDVCYTMLEDLAANIKTVRLQTAISGEAIFNSNCFVELRAGPGGEDSFDWTQMLAKMITKWTQNELGYKTTLVDCNETELGRGYRQATLKITGESAFGYLRAIAGVHRLVRISPFDAKGKRHTSLAQLVVYPEIAGNRGGSSSKADLLKEGDLRVDTYRASGPGGQHVNTTDSAVRLTHLPTGLVVTSQSERSQHSNKANAMTMLLAKLAVLQREQQERRQRESMLGEVSSSAWGRQIVSVVMQPYQLVKDHRTGWETAKVESYLAGGKVTTELVHSSLMYRKINEDGN